MHSFAWWAAVLHLTSVSWTNKPWPSSRWIVLGKNRAGCCFWVSLGLGSLPAALSLLGQACCWRARSQQGPPGGLAGLLQTGSHQSSICDTESVFDGRDDKRPGNCIGPCNQGQCWHPSQLWQLLPFLSSPPRLSQLDFFFPLSCFMYLISLRCWELFFSGGRRSVSFGLWVGQVWEEVWFFFFFFLYCRPVAN